MALIEKLTAIADAIRGKTGKESKLTLEQIATEIEGIPTGSTEIEDGFFRKNLTYYRNDRVTTLPSFIFSDWTVPLTVVFPNVIGITNNNVFFRTSVLKVADFYKIEKISSSLGFYNNNIEALIIRTEKRCTLGFNNTFQASSIEKGTGYIYVPKSLIEQYKVATNWIAFAEQFRAIEDYPEICGGAEQ